MLLPVNVAHAAPVTPDHGNGPKPKIMQGSSARLMIFDTHNSRIAIAASPGAAEDRIVQEEQHYEPLPPSRILA